MHGKLRLVRLISRTASSPGPLCKVADHFSRSSTGPIAWFRSANSRREVCVKPRAIWPGRCSGTTQRGDWEGACAARAPKLHPPPGAHSHSHSHLPCSCGGKGRGGEGRGGKKRPLHGTKQSSPSPAPPKGESNRWSPAPHPSPAILPAQGTAPLRSRHSSPLRIVLTTRSLSSAQPLGLLPQPSTRSHFHFPTENLTVLFRNGGDNHAQP